MAWDESRTAALVRTVTERVRQASRGSTVVGGAESLATRIEALVRGSYGYRWLTAEPDPSIVVIDLRETYAVGPFVRLLERVVEPAARAWPNSRLSSVSTTSGAVFSGSRTARALAALLEPPEPPEKDPREKRE